MRWSRTDQAFLEGLLWVVPALGALAVLLEVVAGVRGEPVEVTGPLPDSLTRPAEGVAGPLTGTVTIEDPSWGDRAYVLLPLVAVLVLVVLGARLLLGIVRGLRTGDPFTAGSARRLTALALLVLAGGMGVQVVANVSQDVLMALALPDVDDRPSVYGLSFWPVPVGALLLFLAEVFARGARLREDVEGLV